MLLRVIPSILLVTITSMNVRAGVMSELLYSQSPSAGPAHMAAGEGDNLLFDPVRTADSFVVTGNWSVQTVA